MVHAVKAHLADNVHDPDGTVVVEITCLMAASCISTQEPHQCAPTISRLCQDDRGVPRYREELGILGGEVEEGGGADVSITDERLTSLSLNAIH